MKLIFKESSVNYNQYNFGYSIYAILDSLEEIESTFNKGFLPFSNDINSSLEKYYLARSLRIKTSIYERISENNRVIRKVDDKLDISYQIIDKLEFDHSDEFKTFCLNYSKERFSNKPLSGERLNLILTRLNYNKIFIFYSKKIPIGYVLTYTNENMIHFWFSFYDTKFMKNFSLGKYIMEQVIFYSKKHKINFVYLGTCYGKKALYKVRDFKGIEFYDGNEWNDNVKVLKKLCKKDSIN
jgi:arginyl-tRNA--protein-N-Asp/Glu arginylyltransferase|tara:strand:+ start:531 stop:1250 length:720 start_codon:yes stop_codon:yes gene_type:complete